MRDPSAPNNDELRELTEPMPTELEALVRKLVDAVNAQDSANGRKRAATRFIERAGVPIGLPTIVADFAHPDKTPREQAEARRKWVREHDETIRLNLPAGQQPAFEQRPWDQDPLVTIPIKPNIVTRRFAQRILRDVVAPEDASTPMIEQFSTDAESKYKFMAINAMGVGTNSAAATTADTQLGAGASPADQFCWYHITTTAVTKTDDGTFGDSLPSAGVDDDLTLDTAFGVEVSATDGASFFSGLRPATGDEAESVNATLSYFDGTGDGEPTDDDFAFQYELTWPFGTDGEERDGNFGSDASPDSWREVALANNLHGTTGHNVVPGGAHPDLVHHLGTRKVFAGNGFAKTSDSRLSNRYKVRFSAG